jgi:hypothetical protein
MGARGRGSNPLQMAVKAAANPHIRPRRLRQVQWSALDDLWRCYRPPDGSRLKKFEAAYVKVARQASELQILPELFDEWSDRLRFMVDDRDDGAEFLGPNLN